MCSKDELSANSKVTWLMLQAHASGITKITASLCTELAFEIIVLKTLRTRFVSIQSQLPSSSSKCKKTDPLLSVGDWIGSSWQLPAKVRHDIAISCDKVVILSWLQVSQPYKQHICIHMLTLGHWLVLITICIAVREWLQSVWVSPRVRAVQSPCNWK